MQNKNIDGEILCCDCYDVLLESGGDIQYAWHLYDDVSGSCEMCGARYNPRNNPEVQVLDNFLDNLRC